MKRFILYFGVDDLIEDILLEAGFDVEKCECLEDAEGYTEDHPEQKVDLFLSHVTVEDPQDGLKWIRRHIEKKQKGLVISSGLIDGVPQCNVELIIEDPQQLVEMIECMLGTQPKLVA